jgi:hypothetical protein
VVWVRRRGGSSGACPRVGLGVRWYGDVLATVVGQPLEEQAGHVVAYGVQVCRGVFRHLMWAVVGVGVVCAHAWVCLWVRVLACLCGVGGGVSLRVCLWSVGL